MWELKLYFYSSAGGSKKKKEKSVVYKSTWYLVRYMQAPNRLYKSEVRASVLRVKTPREQGLPHYTYVLQSRATPSFCDGGEGEAQFPHGTWTHCEAPPCVESAMHAVVSGRGVSAPSSALHRKSSHAQVSVMLEKRGGRCRTDGPIRVLPCQMRHTIAAIKAAWCRSLS